MNLLDEVKEELDYLRWFYENCDFGPAHEDVIMILQKRYVEKGGKIPEGYEYE